ncbi:MAG: hypothetical protein HY253_09635 [Burkholderiales bacterium]|nr:hypothetical protein [Burkholderiales bacterium]
MLLQQLVCLELDLSGRIDNTNELFNYFDIDIELHYYLRPDDQNFTANAENILAKRSGTTKYKMFSNLDWSVGFEHLFGFTQHCWLFHDLYAPNSHNYPALSIQDMLRIGDIWINVVPQFQYFIDAPIRAFSLRYICPLNQHYGSTHFTTYSGKRIPTFPDTPRQNDFKVEDIIQGLSNQCKYFGQTKHFYSIAQHSLLVASLLPQKLRPAALLYSAPIAYMGELPNNLKPKMHAHRRYENRLRSAIGHRFGVSPTLFDSALLKEAKSRVEATEQRDVLPNIIDTVNNFETVKPMQKFITYLSPEDARKSFHVELKKYLPSAFNYTR